MTYKTNGVVALDGVTVTIEDGEFIFIVGASGAGKSSFLSVIMGQEHVDSGIIRVGPYNLKGIRKRDLPYLRRMLGVVFQDFRLIPKMTVYDNIAFALRVIGMSEKKITRRVHYVLTLVDLSDKTNMLPHQLSTGERQRVAIARAIVNNPSVIIADEPTGNLDPVLSSDIMSLFDKINSLGATVIVVTHDLELVHQFDHRIVTLENGRIVSDIPPSDVMRRQRAEALLSEKIANESEPEQELPQPVEEIEAPAPESVFTTLDEAAMKYLDDIQNQQALPSDASIDEEPAPVLIPLSIDDTDYRDYLDDSEKEDLDGQEGKTNE